MFKNTPLYSALITLLTYKSFIYNRFFLWVFPCRTTRWRHFTCRLLLFTSV